MRQPTPALQPQTSLLWSQRVSLQSPFPWFPGWESHPKTTDPEFGDEKFPLGPLGPPQS